MRIRGVIALGVLVLSVRAEADTYPRQPAIDVIHYVFRLSLMPGTDHQIDGDTTVGIRINTAGTREIVLELASAKNGTGMTVTSVVSGADALKFTHAADRLTVMFAAPPRQPNA
jgi:aminopeptidase N